MEPSSTRLKQRGAQRAIVGGYNPIAPQQDKIVLAKGRISPFSKQRSHTGRLVVRPFKCRRPHAALRNTEIYVRLLAQEDCRTRAIYCVRPTETGGCNDHD